MFFNKITILAQKFKIFMVIWPFRDSQKIMTFPTKILIYLFDVFLKIEILDIICDFLTVCSMIAVAGNLGLAGLLMVQILSGNAGEE